MSRWFIISATCLLAACASTQTATPPTEPPAAAVQVPTILPKDVRWVRNSAEYRAVLEQTYRLAGEALARRVADRPSGSWAVAIDADETLIGNSEQSKEVAVRSPEEYLLPASDRVSFKGEWDAWVERRAAPSLPGARRFLGQVRKLGGRIAIVTNRRQRHCPQTADNLRAQQLPFDVLLCRGEDRDKASRWQSVESGTASPDLPPLEIVMWVGDNIHDFPGLDQELRFAGPEAMGEFGDKFFVLPNPLYGSWEHNPSE
jgi:5'-nucleotidase (lipoprotein e(P4) family)